MEPITTAIIAAIAAGALKAAGSIGEKAIADSYAGLKALIVRKFGQQSDVVKAVESVEARPESAGRQQTLAEEAAAAKLDQDQDVVKAAQELIEQIKAQPGGQAHIQSAVGSYIAQADRGSTAQVHVNQPRE
jgi:hypothetical protein